MKREWFARLKLISVCCLIHLIGRAQCINMITYRRLIAVEAPRVAKLFGDAFPLDGPHSWARAVGFTNSLEGYMKTYVPTPINSDLGSFGAWFKEREGEGETLVGSVLIEPFDHVDEKDGSEGEDYLTPRIYKEPYDAIEGLLEACTTVFFRELLQRNPEDYSKLQTKERKSGYISWIATDEAHRRKYIANSLIQHACERMKEEPFNYDYAIAYCVGPAATKTFIKEGFELWRRIEYKSFAMKGEDGLDIHPYSTLPDEVSVVVKKL